MRNGSLFILMTLGIAISFVHAQTYIPAGNVSGTWDTAGSPYYIQGEITIPATDTLDLDPGVEVLFEGHYKLIIYGTLRAVGTEDDSIRFSAVDPGTGWHGIRFYDAPDGSIFDYCDFTHGWANVWSSPEGNAGAILCSNSSPEILHTSISLCEAYGHGAAIHLTNNSSPHIEECWIAYNWADQRGGAISCEGSSPSIIRCCLTDNSCNGDGGGVACWDGADAEIIGNIITDNHAGDTSGGIFCYYADPYIQGNLVQGNSCDAYCSGINAEACSPVITGNIISENGPRHGINIDLNASPVVTGNIIHANNGGIRNLASGSTITHNIIVGNYYYDGGGLYTTSNSNLVIENNLFAYNSADASSSGQGGGLYFSDNWVGVELVNNTFYGNYATQQGGGIFYLGNYDSSIKNCIFWNNIAPTHPQMGGDFNVTYSDVEGGAFGPGNIDIYPEFADTRYLDLRLCWGSDCIDAGDPDPIYNDPDGTVNDMGAFFYDQSLPVSIRLKPHDIPVVISSSGGNIEYTISATNISTSNQTVEVWCDVTLPDGMVYGPVLGPVTVEIGGEVSLDRVRNQTVPASAPWGMYAYNAYAVAGPDTSMDSFMFAKAGMSGGDGSSGWINTGEAFENIAGYIEPSLPMEDNLLSARPNPFNPSTVIGYALPAKAHVNLAVYDVSGRKVAQLVNGWREAGQHELVFDATGLPSGVYYCAVRAGGTSAVEKIVLVK